MWMSIAVLVFSALPLAFMLAKAGDSPFLFGAGLRAGQCAGVLVCLVVVARTWRVPGPVFKKLWKYKMRRPEFPWLRGDVLLVAISFLEYGLMIQAANFVDMPIAALLLETWPVMFVLLTRSLFRHRKRFVPMGVTGWAAVGLGLAGMAAVAFARWSAGLPETAGVALAGGALAVSAALALALSGFGFRWATEVVEDLRLAETIRQEIRCSTAFRCYPFCGWPEPVPWVMRIRSGWLLAGRRSSSPTSFWARERCGGEETVQDFHAAAVVFAGSGIKVCRRRRGD